MLDGGIPVSVSQREGGAGRPARVAVDALITGGGEVWVVVSRPGDGLEELLQAADPATSPMRLCRQVLKGGVVMLGEADADRDPRLSDLLRGGDRDWP